MNIGLCSLYCLYVLASGATFSLGWFLFWLFFGFIVVLSFFVIMAPIAIIITIFCSNDFYEKFKNGLKTTADKLEKYLIRHGKIKK